MYILMQMCNPIVMWISLFYCSESQKTSTTTGELLLVLKELLYSKLRLGVSWVTPFALLFMTYRWWEYLKKKKNTCHKNLAITKTSKYMKYYFSIVYVGWAMLIVIRSQPCAVCTNRNFVPTHNTELCLIPARDSDIPDFIAIFVCFWRSQSFFRTCRNL